MIRLIRVLGFGLSVMLLSIAFAPLALSGPQAGGGTTQQPGFADKTDGEVDRIQQRIEWFFESRRAGLLPGQEMEAMRRAAVAETRQALAVQQAGQPFGANFWFSMGPSPSGFGDWNFGDISGRIQAIEANWDDGILYVGAGSGGVWKSTNDGLSWESIFDTAGTLAVGAVHVDPADSNVLWVGTGDNIVGCETYFGIGLLRSPDGGQTWEVRNGTGGATLDELSSFAGITVDPRDSNRIVVGGRYSGCSNGNAQAGAIYSSEDGGATWTNRLANHAVHEIARNPSDPDTVWASTTSGVYKSENNGVTWNLQTASGLPSGNLSRTELAIAPSDPDTVYVLFNTPSDQFWRTTDGGASWSMMNPDACDGQCWYNMVIRVDSADPDVIYRGTIRLYRSVDGGANWTQLTDFWGSDQEVHQDMQSMLVHPTIPGVFYIGSDGGLWKSEDGGNSYYNLNGNLNVTQFFAIDTDRFNPGKICGGAQDNSSLATINSLEWSRQLVTGDGFLCYFDPQDALVAYATSYPTGGLPSVYRTETGLFGSYQKVTLPGSGITSGDRINWVTPYVLDPSSSSTLYLGTHRAYRSDDRGTSWTQVGPTDLTGDGSSTLKVIEVNRGFPSTVFSGATSGAVWRSTNGGVDWTDLTTGLPSRGINDIAGDPTNADRAFAVVGGFNTAHLWEWNLAGGWTARGLDLPNVPANSVLMLSDSDLLVGMDTGVFRSVDGGLSFLPFMAGLPQGLVVTDLKYSETLEIVTAGTYGRGAWQVNTGPPQVILIAVGVEQPLVQVDGDGDDRLEPGETWSVRPILHNAGGVGATGVTARLASSTPGITILTPDPGSFGDLAPGVAAPVTEPFVFVVDPSFACGDSITLDLIDVASGTPADTYPDLPGFFAPMVLGQLGPPITTTVIDEDFEGPPNDWTHQVVPVFPLCPGVNYADEWNLTSKDEAHGTSYHCGNGPGNTYGSNYAWLFPGGKDSLDDTGFTIPSDAISARLTLVHWYDTVEGADGGQVAIDAHLDDLDVYQVLQPIGGYPGTLDSDSCNFLEGEEAFQGSSGGWITTVFDLESYIGSQVYLSFVFGAGEDVGPGEGWYIDELRIEYQEIGGAICDVTSWPGIVPTTHFNRVDASTLEASWDASCNIAGFPEQTYSIQAGDLSTLSSGGGYTHVPVNDQCDLASTTSFSPGPGDEYYLVVPVGDGREGGAGPDSAGTERPQPGTVCGVRRVATCP